MLIFDNESNKITVIAKDTGDLLFAIDNYNLDTGDTVTFTINSAVELETPLKQKVYTEFTDHQLLIHLTQEDTNLPVGSYLYDIQVDTADGRTDTVIGPAKFQVKGGVTY